MWTFVNTKWVSCFWRNFRNQLHQASVFTRKKEWHSKFLRKDIHVFQKRRARPPTPVFLPGESHGQRSLVGLPSMGSQRVRQSWSDLAHVHVHVENPETKPNKTLGFVWSRGCESALQCRGCGVWSPVREDPTRLGATKPMNPKFWAQVLSPCS